MNVAEVVLNFYLEVFKRDVVRTKNMIGFTNNFFVNPIMTPNFVLGQVSDKEVVEQSLSVGTNDLWFNCFESFYNTCSFKKDIILSPEYIVETDIHSYNDYELDFEIFDSSFSKNESYQRLVCSNSYNLSVKTQINIIKVLSHSDSRVETFVARNESGEICAGATLVHGRASSMLINGFVDEKYRGSGVFKAFHANCKKRCFDLGCDSVFYWTFSDRLKGNGQYSEKLCIVR